MQLTIQIPYQIQSSFFSPYSAGLEAAGESEPLASSATASTPPAEKKPVVLSITETSKATSIQPDKTSEASGGGASVMGEGGDDGGEEEVTKKKKKKKKAKEEEKKPVKRPGKGVPVGMIKKLQAAREEEERLRQEELLRLQKEEEEREQRILEKVN